MTTATGPEPPTRDPGVDRRLIARAARGDAHAFAEIYASSAPGVRRYVRTIIWNSWDAEDVTQEVFVKIFTSLRQYDPERATFSAWTLRVARNAAIDHMRRARRRATCEEIDQGTPLDEAGRHCAESLREALAELSESQRQVLVLRALAGFTPCEVASHAKASRGSVNTLYHRARLAARDRLTALDAAPCTRRVSPATPGVMSEAA
jgi:RNA polymerase sigma-70 factor (ECF subfamily)